VRSDDPREKDERAADADSEEKARQPDNSDVKHYPGHVGCSTFWCARAMEMERDEPDPLAGWF
jgi:hypothetical protein